MSEHTITPGQWPTAAAPEREKPTSAEIAEGRRRVCLTTAVQMVHTHLLLPWEAVDYSKYLEDYLTTGTVPREEVLSTKPDKPAKRKLHS